MRRKFIELTEDEYNTLTYLMCRNMPMEHLTDVAIVFWMAMMAKRQMFFDPEVPFRIHTINNPRSVFIDYMPLFESSLLN